jgi:hypothetical protein
VAYTDQATLAKDATFRDKVRVAVMTAAIAIAGEVIGGHDTTQYGKRQQLAALVLLTGGGGNWLEVFSWAITQNAAITSSSTDSDIQFTCNSVWDDIAGVTGLD